MQRLIDRVLDEEELLERLEKEEEDMADGVNGGFNEPALRKIKSEMAEFGGVVTGDYEIDLNTARNATLKCEPSSTTHADAAEGTNGSTRTLVFLFAFLFCSRDYIDLV